MILTQSVPAGTGLPVVSVLVVGPLTVGVEVNVDDAWVVAMMGTHTSQGVDPSTSVKLSF